MKNSLKTKCKKPTDVDINQVVEWIITGNSMFNVGEALEERWPDQKDYQKALMGSVQQYLTESGNADAAVIKGWCLESLRDIYRRMIQIGDFNNAAKVVRDINKMAGG